MQARPVSRRAVAPVLLAAALLALLARPGAAAEDAYRPQQWALERVRVPAAWSRSLGRDVVIAVVDTGVDLRHPDLVDRFVRDGEGRVVGRDFVDDDDEPQDRNGHGTMVAGIALATADNVEGIAGVAPLARLLPVRVLDADGGGRAADLEAGIRWAVDNGADVINLSLERAEEPGTVDRALEELLAPASAVQYAWDRGVVVVAAAGNSGSSFTDYPESSPVLLVGATDRDDRRAGFSDSGRRDAVVAPGVDIVSTWCDPVGTSACDEEHRYGVASGTSFAAPFVTGTAALLRELGFDNHETVARIRQYARDLGEPGPDDENGYGLLDAGAAVGVPDPDRTAPPQPQATSAPPEVTPADDGYPTSPAPGESPAAGGEASPGPTPTPAAQATDRPTPTDPSPVAAPRDIPPERRAALRGLAIVLLLVVAAAFGVVVHRHGLTRRRTG